MYVISRPLDDVDLFTDDEPGVAAVAEAVQTSLRLPDSGPSGWLDKTDALAEAFKGWEMAS